MLPQHQWFSDRTSQAPRRGAWRAELHSVSCAFFLGRPTDVSALVSRFAEFVPLKKKKRKKRTYYIQLPSCHKRDILTPKAFGGTESQNEWRFLIKYNAVLCFSHFTTDHRRKPNMQSHCCVDLCLGSNGFVETSENFGLNHITVARPPLVCRLISIWFLSIMFNDNS